VFFFQAEDGIRAFHVTGVQTCALPILIGRKLKKLDDVISVSVVEPALTGQGWRFGDYPGSTPDTVNGATYLHEVYTRADPHINEIGRASCRERGKISGVVATGKAGNSK